MCGINGFLNPPSAESTQLYYYITTPHINPSLRASDPGDLRNAWAQLPVDILAQA